MTTRGRVVAAGLVGAILVLASTAAPWIGVQSTDAAGRAVSRLTGAQTHGLLMPLALAGAAGSFALTLVDGWGRRVVALIVALCGLGAVGLGIVTLAAPTARTTSMATTSAAAATAVPSGPATAIVGGLLLLAAGVLATVKGPTWPTRSARRARTTPGETARSDWDRLSEGEDPTA